MSSNRTTIAQLREMDAGQVSRLPVDQLALLADDVATLKTDAKTLGDKLTSALHARFCTLKVEPAGIDRRTGQHKDTHNKITGYQPMSGTTVTARPTAPPPAPAQPPRPAAAAPATPPWRRQA